MNQTTSKNSAAPLFGENVSAHGRGCGRGFRSSASISRFGVMAVRCGSLVFAFLLLLAAGCGTTRDIANDKRYVTDYRVGDLFQTLQPVYYWTGQLMRTKTPDISETVETGSRIKITKVQLREEPELGRQMLIRGRILDGHLADREVELGPISQFQVQRQRSTAVYFVDTTILKRIPE